MTDFDPVELKRIRWHSRRGLLELDLVLERFLAQRFDSLSPAEMSAYKALLELPDNDFLDVVNGKMDLDDPEIMHIVEILRAI